jgi:hypothetical protein
VRMWRVRVLPSEPGSGGPVRWAQEPGEAGCWGSGGRREVAVGADLAGDLESA